MVSRLPVFQQDRAHACAAEMVLPVFVLGDFLYRASGQLSWHIISAGSVLYLLSLRRMESYRDHARNAVAPANAAGQCAPSSPAPRYRWSPTEQDNRRPG